jgi:hypothetical protein
LARPATVVVVPVVAIETPSGLEATVYEMIVEPPSEADGIQLTVACPAPPVAVTPVGASGGCIGVIEFDGLEDALVPTTLVAVTVNA